MKISVIVPVYNGEMYLKKCIESLLGQTHRDLELILVDDGSEDRSGEICDACAGADPRIRVIHKKNQGLVRARITGLKEAGCEAVSFVDADDWVEPDFLECLAGALERRGADLAASGCLCEKGDVCTRETNAAAPGVYEGERLREELYPHMLYYKGFYQFGIQPYLWNKLFRRDLLLACYREMDTAIDDGEDAAVVFPYLLTSGRVVILEDCLYHYRIHEGSMSFRKGEGFYGNVSRLYLHLDKMFRRSEYYDIMLPQLDQYMRRMVWLGTPEKAGRGEEYCFPFGKVAPGSGIILYGAGVVGQSYYRQLKKTGYCSILSWADRNHLGLSEQGFPVVSPQEAAASGRACDCAVVALADEGSRREAAEYLVSQGVRKERIVFGEE